MMLAVNDDLAQGVHEDAQQGRGMILRGKLFVDLQADRKHRNLRQKATNLRYGALDVANSLPSVDQVLYACSACAS